MTGLETALERIEECRRTRSIQLDLSKLDLSEIPEQVFQLTKLMQIDCAWNQISDLSPLSQLLHLTQINCGSNQVSDLSPLSQLQ